MTLNPLYPGDVIQLDPEIRYLSYSRCYTGLKGGKYKSIQDYKEGMFITTAIGLKIHGEFLNEKIAEIDARGNANFENTAVITVSPLSADTADLVTLEKVGNDPGCRIITEILNGDVGRYAIAATVLHGRVNIMLRARISRNLAATAKGELFKIVSKSFGIDESAIQITGDFASFNISESPDEMTLAIKPARFSREELARITYYLQGERGADLEIAVREAIRAPEIGVFEKWRIYIASILGDEVKNRERWAENLLKGKTMQTAEELKNDVDFAQVGNYGAAMEILLDQRPEIPSAIAPPEKTPQPPASSSGRPNKVSGVIEKPFGRIVSCYGSSCSPGFFATAEPSC
jgi:hypothetical protein